MLFFSVLYGFLAILPCSLLAAGMAFFFFGFRSRIRGCPCLRYFICGAALIAIGCLIIFAVITYNIHYFQPPASP